MKGSLTEYTNIIKDLKEKFKTHQIKASIKVNSELLQFYWYMGQKIIEVQKEYKWGSKFLANLSKDLSKEFPDVKGFSYRNLKNIRQWVNFWDNEKGKQVVSQLFHRELMNSLPTLEDFQKLNSGNK